MVQTVDVLQAEIAMALANAAVSYAGGEKALALSHEFVGIRVDGSEGRAVEGTSDVGSHLLEVFLPVAANRLQLAELGNPFTCRRSLVEIGNSGSDSGQERSSGFMIAHAGFEGRFIRQPYHDDREVDHFFSLYQSSRFR
jgi:hypothetical protein